MACRWSGANQLRPLCCHQRRETKRSPADHLGDHEHLHWLKDRHGQRIFNTLGWRLLMARSCTSSDTISDVETAMICNDSEPQVDKMRSWSPALSLKFLKFEAQSCFNMFQPIAFKTTIRPVPWGQPRSHSPRLHSRPGGRRSRPRGLHRDPHCRRSRRPQRSHGGVLNGARIFRVFSCFFHVLSGGFRMLNEFKVSLWIFACEIQIHSIDFEFIDIL
jgi:hypothetical protein